MSVIPGYYDAGDLAAKYGITETHARKLIRYIGGAHQFRGKWLVRETAVPSTPPSLALYERRKAIIRAAVERVASR